MGIIGTGIAGILMNLVVFIIQFIYANFFVQDLKETLGWPDSRIISWEGIKSYMKIGGPSILTFVLDSWVFEALLLLSGYFGVES
jgi:Na+-driven multidrug efflux pump